MVRVRFDDGTVINFEGDPSPDDISDAYEHAKSIRGTAGNIPKTENFLQRAMRGVKTAGEIAGGGFRRMVEAGPASFNVITGGPGTAFAGGVKTEALARTGLPESIAESISASTDPQSILMGGGLARSVPKLPIGKAIGNILTKKGRLAYFDRIEDAVYNARKAAAPKFKSALDDMASKHPNEAIDMSSIREKANVLYNSNDEVRSLIDQSPEFMNILTKPEGMATIHEAQNALNSLTTRIPRSVLTGAGKRSRHVPVIDLIDDLKLSMSEKFPEMSAARRDYGEVVENFRKIRPKVSEDAAAKNLFANYNPLNPRGKEFMGGERSEERFRRLVPKNIFREAILTRKAQTAKTLGTAAIGTGIAGALGSKVWRKISGGK